MQPEQFRLNHELELAHWWFVARRAILRSLAEGVVRPGERRVVVDVGCGTGGNLAAFADDYECIGIDPSEDAIRLARSRYANAKLICGHAPDDLGDDAARADLFLLTDVIEHVDDDFQLVSRLWAAAKPGAMFLITVPAELALWSMHDVSHAHYRRYDIERLKRVWRDLPATTLMVSAFNARLYPAVKFVRSVNRRLGRSGGAAGTDLRMPPRVLNAMLTRLFAGERRVLRDLLDGRRTSGYARGVSLVAVVRRDAGAVTPATRPADVAADLHGPDLDLANTISS